MLPRVQSSWLRMSTIPALLIQHSEASTSNAIRPGLIHNGRLSTAQKNTTKAPHAASFFAINYLSNRLSRAGFHLLKSGSGFARRQWISLRLWPCVRFNDGLCHLLRLLERLIRFLGLADRKVPTRMLIRLPKTVMAESTALRKMFKSNSSHSLDCFALLIMKTSWSPRCLSSCCLASITDF